MAWRKKRDPLYRGDSAAGVAHPNPVGNESIVAHILYLDGAGRSTRFQSTSESEAVASHFAAKGKVYRTTVPRAEAEGVAHLSQLDLLGLLRGTGKGRAKWKSALEVMMARRLVEQWSEHLLDFSSIDSVSVAKVLTEIYEP